MARSLQAPACPVRLERLYLGVASFIAGAALMVIEISAARLLAPLFGNSIYTWTALIGVILIAFSIGGYLGGRLADRRGGLDLLGWLFATAAVLTFLIPGLSVFVMPMLVGSGLVLGPVVSALLLFGAPGVLLGAISPASVRLYSSTWGDIHVGSAAGTISMLGSLGSFLGTFLAGFVLLGAFGVRSVFMGCAGLLLLLALFAFTLARGSSRGVLVAIAAGLLGGSLSAFTNAPGDNRVIHERESFYHRARVIETGSGANRRRYLQLDSTVEGGINPDTGALVLDYQHYWRLALIADVKIDRALFIGAGAFGMPNELSREHPLAVVDVIELDPKVIEIGREFFHLGRYPGVRAHAGDARHFLNVSPGQRWNVIFADAYNGVNAIPTHLATREFFGLVSERLAPEGLYLMNVISSVQGPRAELLGGILVTLRQVFPHVEIFAVHAQHQKVQTVIVMASHRDYLSPIIDRRHAAGSLGAKLASSHVPAHLAPRSDTVFSDDFNPVDSIIARALLR